MRNFNFSFLNTTQRKQDQQWWFSTQYLTVNTFEIWYMFQRGGRVGRKINCFHPWLVLNKRRMTPEGRRSRDLCYCYWSVKPWQHLWIHVLHILPTLSQPLHIPFGLVVSFISVRWLHGSCPCHKLIYDFILLSVIRKDTALAAGAVEQTFNCFWLQCN